MAPDAGASSTEVFDAFEALAAGLTASAGTLRGVSDTVISDVADSRATGDHAGHGFTARGAS